MAYRVNVILLGACIFACFLLPGCASTTAADHAKRNAHISMKDLLGDPPTAEERQARADEALRLAVAAHENSNHRLALRQAFNAIQNDPASIHARKIHADSLLHIGNYPEAEKGFKSLLDRAPDGEIYEGYGLSILKQDRTKDARAALSVATDINSELWQAWNGIGQSYAMEEEWARADEAYQKALAIDPNQPKIYNNVGLSFLAQDKYLDAQTAFAKAKALPNGGTIADNNYRLALALNGNPDQAFMGLSDIQRAQLYNTLGQTALRTEDKNAAIGYFKKAISHYPSHYAEAARNLETALTAH